MEPCSICKTPTEYEAQDKPLCHHCAVLVLEFIRLVDFIHAFDDAEHSVHWIGGESVPFQALPTPEVNPLAEVDQLPPANQ